MTDAYPTILNGPAESTVAARSETSQHHAKFGLVRRSSWIALRLVVILAVIWIAFIGIRLRAQIWDGTTAIHYHGDIQNTLRQGEAVLEEGTQLAGLPPGTGLTWPQFFRGYLHRYDTVLIAGSDNQYDLDYTPARLLIAGIWVRHLQLDHPNRQTLIPSDIVPLLNLNTVCELAAAVMMFLLVNHWWRRRYPRRPSISDTLRTLGGPPILTRADQPWILGLLSACVLWFNPALLLNAHAWPQWDVWLLPFFIGALWFASREWWLTAGMLISSAAMFKGQLLIVAPIFILWPLFGGRLGAAIRFIVGGLFAGAVLTSPWLVGDGWFWASTLVETTIVLALLAGRGDWLRAGIGGWVAAIAIELLVLMPWMVAGRWPPIVLVVSLSIVILATPWIVRRMSRSNSGVWIAFATTLTIAAASDAFAGTWAWFEVGFRFPTWHYPMLANGLAQNVPALLEKVYDWHLYDTAFLVDLGRSHWQFDVTIKLLLSAIYGVALVMCAIAAAVHSRRNNPRVLLALTAPWILMYALCPQLMTRYLIWGAMACSVGWAISVELALMNLLVTVLAFLMMLHTMLLSRAGPFSQYPKTYRLLQNAYPGLSWMIALVAAIYLYLVVSSLWRGQKDAPPQVSVYSY